MKQIVISEFMDTGAVDTLKQRFEVVYDPFLVDRRDALLTLLGTTAGLIVRNRTQVDSVLIDAAPRLQVVGRLGVGLDNIDLPACRTRGIAVFPATGANAVAEYVIAMALVLLRGAYRTSREVAAGVWSKEALSNGRELSGKVLGIVGFGSIGQLTARKASALGMRVLGFDPAVDSKSAAWEKAGARSVTLDELITTSDAVSLHLPLTPETKNIFDRSRIASMKRDAVLINSARGGIVDETALADLLRSGHLAGAALDVFAKEPLPAGSPLADCPNLLLTPHIAGLTRESNQRVSSLVVEKVSTYLAGLK
ncbi:MAG: hydroxyacid dehydrogenase [Sulfuricaulis sp.]|uniref:hydroxyacid dehydrogenase n=1 Tax=Sulfuricaulis sp. TaxID=2003553 RepID=UPI0034A155F9